MRILVAYGDGLTMAGIRRALHADGDFEIVGETRDGSDLIALVEASCPDVVLLDSRLPGVKFIQLLSLLRATHPKVDVVVSSVSSDREDVRTAFRHGASGYIVESINPADLGSAIRQATKAHPFSSTEASRVTTSDELLTERELEVVEAVSRGLSNKAIADELWVTVQTVKFHLTSIYRKLGLSNRTQAARWALSKDLAQLRDEHGRH